jgi:hypothetical protein
MKRSFFLATTLILIMITAPSFAGISETKSFKMSVTLPESIQSLEQTVTSQLTRNLAYVPIYQDSQYTQIVKNDQTYVLKTFVIR